MSSQPSKPVLFNAAMAIISKESGIAVSELTDECAFDDIGMDSLLCLMVSSRLRDELDMDLDSAKFLEFGTISSLRDYFAELEPHQQVIVSESVKETVVETLVGNHTETAATSSTWTEVIDIISQESGIAAADLTDDTCFADVGVDSLLSLLIWSRLKDEVGLDLEHTSPFLEFETIGSFKSYIMGSSSTPSTDVPSSGQETPPSPAESSASSSPGPTPLWTPGEPRSSTPETGPSSENISVNGDKV